MFFYLICTNNTFASFTIISDFDDTIKRSNIVDSGKRTLGNAFLFHKVYRGIPTLYRAMEKESNGLYVLSASPSIVKPFIKSSLKDFKIPNKDVFTRYFWELYGEERKIEYKINEIENVLSYSGDDVVLLGDNVEADHILYSTISNRNPGRVAQIYIRKVLNQNIPEDIFGFYTPYEVAANEYYSGRLSFEAVERVARTVMDTSTKNFYQVIPYYAHCPLNSDEFPLIQSGELDDLSQRVFSRVSNYCSQREVILEQ
jgi:hypothetical protein